MGSRCIVRTVLMCRIAAFIGAPCRLDTFLSAPPHSLARQAWDARETISSTVNADGWGVAWYDDAHVPAVYRHILPIWADGNLDALSRSLTRPVWLANVRSATSGLGTDHANTQPFAGDGLIFVHNGYIERFSDGIRARMRAEIDPAIEEDINGNTDSEYLFALLRSQPGTPAEKLARAHERTLALLGETPSRKALLNMIVTDGQEMTGLRSSVNAPAPSLYVNQDWHNGQVLASEAFDDFPGWSAVSAESFVTVRT